MMRAGFLLVCSMLLAPRLFSASPDAGLFLDGIEADPEDRVHTCGQRKIPAPFGTGIFGW
jgi:hypothetical protein